MTTNSFYPAKVNFYINFTHISQHFSVKDTVLQRISHPRITIDF
eukprot:UN06939